MSGKLYIVATPIGNLEDITFRALKVLKEADFIAAEDTRHTLKLLNHYEIKTPLISCHEHNERQKSEIIVNRILSGQSCALVTDAGMPIISDPGGTTVSACIQNGIEVTVCPGASAGITALALSGIPAARYCFEGFLPVKSKERKAALSALKAEPRAIVIYEAPHRICGSLSDMSEIFVKRRVCVARELTKKHEQAITGDIAEVAAYFRENEARGEFVIVIEGADESELKNSEKAAWDNIDIRTHVEIYVNQGMSEGDAIKAAAKDRGLPKREVYRAVKIDG